MMEARTVIVNPRGGGPGIVASDADFVLRDVRIPARHDQLEMVRAAEPQGPEPPM